jgi:hypothetical protein
MEDFEKVSDESDTSSSDEDQEMVDTHTQNQD